MSVLHVVFRVGASEYVLPASAVVQMESYTGATPVPGAKDYVAGVVQIRGRVVPVIDTRVRFGLPPIDRGLDGRVIVTQVGDRAVGLLVDSSREVLRLSEEQLKPPPELLVDEAQGFIKAVAQAGPRLVMLVDLDKVVGKEKLRGE